MDVELPETWAECDRDGIRSAKNTMIQKNLGKKDLLSDTEKKQWINEIKSWTSPEEAERSMELIIQSLMFYI